MKIVLCCNESAKLDFRNYMPSHDDGIDIIAPWSFYRDGHLVKSLCPWCGAKVEIVLPGKGKPCSES